MDISNNIETFLLLCLEQTTDTTIDFHSHLDDSRSIFAEMIAPYIVGSEASETLYASDGFKNWNERVCKTTKYVYICSTFSAEEAKLKILDKCDKARGLVMLRSTVPQLTGVDLGDKTCVIDRKLLPKYKTKWIRFRKERKRKEKWDGIE